MNRFFGYFTNNEKYLLKLLQLFSYVVKYTSTRQQFESAIVRKEMREYLVELRAKNQMAQRNVADALEVSRQYYQQIEAGQRQPKLELHLARKLADIFQLTLHDLIEKETAWVALRESVLQAQVRVEELHKKSKEEHQ